MNSIRYDYKSFTLSNGASDYDVASSVAELFNAITVAKNVVITTTKEISFKFNNPLNPAVALTLRKSPFQMPRGFMDVTNIYLSNASGEDSTVEIWLT